MDVKQHESGLQDALNKAVLQAAMPGEGESPSGKAISAGNGKKQAQSPLNGAPVPAGRPAGVKNKLTNLRNAVLEAFDTVGGPEYLVKLAGGTQSDRAAFVGLVAKVLPTQINANVEGGIQVQLSWLGSRQIGTTQTQTVEQVTQVIDLERDSKGKYRIADQDSVIAGGSDDQTVDAQKGAEGAEGA